MNEPLEDLDFLTTKRFEKGLSESKVVFNRLRLTTPSEINNIEKIEEEDIILLVKFKTFKKCTRQIIFILITSVICILIGAFQPLIQFLLVIGVFVLISSISGVITNRITVKQKEYLKN